MQRDLHHLLDLLPLAEGAPVSRGDPPDVGMFAVIEGTEGNDFLNGTQSDDVMRGLGGDDGLFGNRGADTIRGGDGNDNLYGGDGIDTLYGGSGDDSLESTEFGDGPSDGNPSDFLFGGDGIDELIVNYTGWTNPDTDEPGSVTVDISTGSGQVLVDDFLGENFSGMERLFLFAPDGDDVVTGGDHDDVIRGNDGHNVMYGGGGDDLIGHSFGTLDADGGDGIDKLVFHGGEVTPKYGDTVFDAESGIFTMDGESMGSFSNFENLNFYAGIGDDTIVGFVDGVNVISAHFFNTGDKNFYGGNLGDQLTGGAGDDRLYGSLGDDVLSAARGGAASDESDWVYGGRGNDEIYGGASAGRLYGGGGNDLIFAGEGADKIKGGAGDDIYRYHRFHESHDADFDTVVGFDARAADVFDVRSHVGGIDEAVTAGTLSQATFTADLEAAIGEGELATDHAVLFTADAGDYAGETFLIVEFDGEAGYQASRDLVVLLKDAANLNSLDASDFI